MKDPDKERIAAYVGTLRRAYRLLRRTTPPENMHLQVADLLHEVIDGLIEVADMQNWPEPTVAAPDMQMLVQWLWEDGGCETSDGC